jgi:hypothetical protein
MEALTKLVFPAAMVQDGGGLDLGDSWRPPLMDID